MSSTRQRPLGGGAHHILDYLKRMQAENPAFFYAVQDDNDLSCGNIFWADATSRTNYSYFGDAVIFDTTYKTNRYRVPFASFTGFNHHGQHVLFGCALILNEYESSFIWLFKTWLHAMSGRHPVSITTDLDPFLQVAIAQVLPSTRHRFCKWSIFRETRAKLSHLCQSHPAFETEFKKCVHESETIDDFESYWHSFLERFYVMDNEWLQSMYNARQHWVPVFLRDTFFGEISLNEGNEYLNFYFDGYVNSSTTLQVLIRQYEKAVSSWHERELKADYDTTNSSPALKTPSPMEKQAASLYTRKIFMKFQEELVETLANPATKIDESGTITTYRVAKFGENQKSHVVTFNSFEMKASCSCQMFEYSGIICRHILTVFRAKNVLTLPPQYVLKRWTRNAKTGTLLDEHASELPSSTRESVTVRYNNLRQEAIKYVEEGAKSIQIYHVAMRALQEASKKVCTVKNQSTGTAEGATVTNGSKGELLAADADVPSYQSVDPMQQAEKQKKIQELTAELEATNQRCEVYRANLLAVLKDMEEQKLKLSVKVQNARLSLKE
ncbi:protein FAR1-RELATED SEQUENCE 9 isoform X1 [Cajanus cajan]|uniref:protein FAR1-RELATED SEQUENCE 9 isoform X1 n=1 Tax=Cajanus cajan TaxID=3821 RepID=UPI00098D9140|nr:protein FAR1-RELATED SEQUENCE 9 isoform X1 [Cajanus cajan]XP_020230954.1 protein FAR1-RELATED SEQUENCE 9 isoform X1 [Cajanus cajan]XP_020231023.1 protein FAR1-RELATED SEQUENCE 9 isoform X1 [Cajanus cajan]XP_020231092.1 protein FAR1-RELATED SEQUENCE 9 isoform X1 [Cajanus cajan]XP_020231147.1 protein FAR1-RELATED SEQUENCE 9 isoform X1 [Cajanus cajan]XP_029127328.1 protein FAR1-RELATED SEQUENCE 9 isoform X1 [Cajanus cajan]XP_029127329.1 protein FAR1-RELATED SEQUENCE 9 isoform X1 [Cajanus caja